ncbi:aromatic amino acid transport family protein [Flagellimonas sp. S3867]|uniref:aromatic amino acid transport family protein n=1 Tax=Flagellimonas sp. S3867 TaxID=2768063 RepID=UPI001681DCE9
MADFPNGFITAIGFVSLVLIFSFFFISFLMTKNTSKRNTEVLYKINGGNPLLNIFMLSSILIAIFHVLAMLDYLPTW